jgi:Cu-processing system permease protein
MRMTLSPTITIAGWEMRGAARSRWVLVSALLYTLAAVGVALVNLRSMSVLGLRGVGSVVDGLIAVGVLIPPLFGILLGAGAIAGAREQGSLAMIAAQPIRRSAITRGVFIGMTLTVWVSVGIGLGLVAVVTAPVVTSADLVGLATAAGVTLAAGTAGVALGVALSALGTGRGQATALAVAVWFLIALGIDVILVALAPVALGPTGLLALTLVNPLSTIRTLGLMITDPAALGPFGVYLADRFGSLRSVSMLGGSLALWVLAPVAIATSALKRRDV